MLDSDEKMWPGFDDLPTFAQSFGFASKEAISEAREFSKTHQVGFFQGWDIGVDMGNVCVYHVCDGQSEEAGGGQ